MDIVDRLVSKMYSLCGLNVFFINSLGEITVDYSDTLFEKDTYKLLLSVGFNDINQFFSVDSTTDITIINNTIDQSFLATPYKNSNDEYMGFFLLGPFLRKIPNEYMVKKILQTKNISYSSRLSIEKYYFSLKILSVKHINCLSEIIITIRDELLLKNIEVKELSTNTEDFLKTNNIDDIKTIENNYKVQEVFLNAIVSGDIDQMIYPPNFKYLETLINKRTKGININNLRVLKNLYFSTMGMVKYALVQAHVHPINIHILTEKYFSVFEDAKTVKELHYALNNALNESYQLVKKQSSLIYSKYVNKAIQFIYLNIYQQSSLEQVADYLNISKSYISTIFKKETGMTVTEYILHKKIALAKTYLKDETLSITNIAIMLGFNSYNYFYIAFSKVEGISPSEYRKNL